MDTDVCIYCGEGVDSSKGYGDHIIPAAFGEFSGAIPFRRICVGCNVAIGRSEQELIQCSPAGYLAKVLKPASRRTRKRSSGYKKSLGGVPTPEFTVDHGDHHENVEPLFDQPDNAAAIDQLIVTDANEKVYFVPLFPGMTEQHINRRLKLLGVAAVCQVRIRCDDSQFSQYLALVKAVWPQMKKMEEGPTLKAGTHRIDGSIKFTMGEGSFRAIAKIAFHYYLTYTRRGFYGNESCFSDLRRFIRHGSDNGDFRERFFHSSGRRLAMPFGPMSFGGAILPGAWCHILAVNECESVPVVYAQFFVGPKNLPNPYWLTLGRFPTRLILPDCVWSHVFQFEDNPASPNVAGRVIKASCFRLAV